MSQPTDTPLFPPGHPDAPPTPVEKPPPGMAWGISPSGERVLAYLPPATEQPQPLVTGRKSELPKILLAGGASLSAVLGVVGHYAPQLGQAGHAAEMAGVGVGVASAGLGGLVLLVKGSLGRQAGQSVNVQVNVTNTNTARSTARSGRRK